MFCLNPVDFDELCFLSAQAIFAGALKKTLHFCLLLKNLNLKGNLDSREVDGFKRN